MSPYDVYCLYTSIRLHFNSESYDCFKYNFKSSASPKNFETHRNKYHFVKLSRMCADQECRLYLATNFYTNPKAYIRDLISATGKEIYTQRRSVLEALSYKFSKDADFLFSQYRDPNQILSTTGDYPPLLLHVWESDITVESFIVLNHFLNFLPTWKKRIQDTITWPEFYLRVRKYTPFISFDGVQLKKVLVDKLKVLDLAK